MPERLLVVDGNNLLIRAVKATEHVGLSSSDGTPTAAIHVFIQSLTRYVRQEKPSRLVVCWDGGRSAHRLAIDPDYKAQRAERVEGEDVESPFGQAKEFLTLSNVHHVELPGVEADDLVAAYWRAAEPEDAVVILSGDKDFLQLLDGRTEQVRPGGRSGDERWGRERVEADLGCTPESLVFAMALTGDALDNVRGVPGFGHKTACKVLSKHGWSLDAALAAEPRLAEHQEQVRRSLALVDLRGCIPGVDPPAVPRFDPTTTASVMYAALAGYLDHYQLASVRQKLDAGTLWHARKLASTA